MPSNVAGYLLPANTPAPLEDDALDDFLGDVVAGITGLDRDTLVRPRWQPDPPNMPDRSVTWAAVGVVDHDPDTYAYTGLLADGTSQDLIRHETLTIVVTFYGPNSGTVGTQFRDGLMVDQNREALMTAGFGLIDTSGPTKAPELIKEQWYQRSDITWMTRREIRRNYPILSLLSAHGTIYTDHLTVPFDETLPT
jgi:hypothetical protein